MIPYGSIGTLPAGVEVVHCYVPLGWALPDRTLQLKEEYGIGCCDCGRCEVERAMAGDEQQPEEEDALNGHAAKRQKTSESDAAVANGQETQTETESLGGRAMGAGEDGETWQGGAEGEGEHDEERSPWYVSSFLMRHICDKCGGTLAPPECSEGARNTRDTESAGEIDPEGLEQEEPVTLCCTVCDNSRTAQEEKEMFEQMMAAAVVAVVVGVVEVSCLIV